MIDQVPIQILTIQIIIGVKPTLSPQHGIPTLQCFPIQIDRACVCRPGWTRSSPPTAACIYDTNTATVDLITVKQIYMELGIAHLHSSGILRRLLPRTYLTTRHKSASISHWVESLPQSMSAKSSTREPRTSCRHVKGMQRTSG